LSQQAAAKEALTKPDKSLTRIIHQLVGRNEQTQLLPELRSRENVLPLEKRCHPVPKRLRCPGNSLRDLVPAYVNNPGLTSTHNLRHQSDMVVTLAKRKGVRHVAHRASTGVVGSNQRSSFRLAETQDRKEDAHQCRTESRWMVSCSVCGPGFRGSICLRVLTVTAWPVERTISWFHNFGCLRIRRDRRSDILRALMALGMSLICLSFVLA
jgi:hypothetical protein